MVLPRPSFPSKATDFGLVIPRCKTINVCYRKPPRLWCFIPEAPGNQHGGVCRPDAGPQPLPRLASWPGGQATGLVSANLVLMGPASRASAGRAL